MYSSRYASHLHPLAIYSRACINVILRCASVNRAKDCGSNPWIPGGWENISVREARGSWFLRRSKFKSWLQWNYLLFYFKTSKKPDGCLVIKLYSGTLHAKTKVYSFFNNQSGVKTIEYFHCMRNDYYNESV